MSISPEMTAHEQIEYLATKVMQWTTGCPPHCSGCTWYMDKERNDIIAKEQCEWCNANMEYPTFDPLQDWNHWRQVEEKVMENDVLCNKFLSMWRIAGEYRSLLVYLEADLPTRVSALIAAHKELYGQ